MSSEYCGGMLGGTGGRSPRTTTRCTTAPECRPENADLLQKTSHTAGAVA
jgi:hypothetical protein